VLLLQGFALCPAVQRHALLAAHALQADDRNNVAPHHCPDKTLNKRLTVCKRACQDRDSLCCVRVLPSQHGAPRRVPHSWLPPLAGDNSDHELYGRLFGDPAGAQRELPAWAGGAGAYTPFEYVEFEDTEVHHDLEVTVSGRSLRLMLARPQGCDPSPRLVLCWPDLKARACWCLARRAVLLECAQPGPSRWQLRAQRSRRSRLAGIERRRAVGLAERRTGAGLVARSA
jgi:hypothetical protein